MNVDLHVCSVSWKLVSGGLYAVYTVKEGTWFQIREALGKKE